MVGRELSRRFGILYSDRLGKTSVLMDFLEHQMRAAIEQPAPLPNNEDLPMAPVNEDFSEAFMALRLAHQAEEEAKPAPLASYPGTWPPPKQRFPGL